MPTHAHSPDPVPLVRGYALAPDQGVDGRGPEVKCSDRSTGGSLALYRTIVDGQGPPPHRHTREDETIVVLDGTVQVDCADETWTGGTATTFFLPRGLTHTFRSIGGPASILFLITPGQLDEFFRLRDEASDPGEIAELVRRFF